MKFYKAAQTENFIGIKREWFEIDKNGKDYYIYYIYLWFGCLCLNLPKEL